ncbi:hypothetical protein [Chromobacterium phragmitis]|uniref:hypothetical protein n=1 Tax=Chromobacterium phragmitis TaxID=2202141 RepID=UPI0011AE7AE8|nr:hypothetical protein [Chromobacterium phragmitis]
MESIEGRFAGSSREVGFIVDSQSGQIPGVMCAGLVNGAEIRLSAARDYRLLEGNKFTHNHPLGGNLSPSDVATALGSGVTEFRAVSPARTASIIFDNPPPHVFGDPVNSVLFIDGEKAAIGASYMAGIADGSLLPPVDLAAKKIWMSDYFMEQLSSRNSWINYSLTHHP